MKPRRSPTYAPALAGPTEAEQRDRARGEARVNADRPRWLVAFLDRNLDEPLSTGEARQLEEDVLAFIRPGQDAVDFLAHPAAGEIPRLQATVIAALETALRDGLWFLPDIPQTLVLQIEAGVVRATRNRMFTLRHILAVGDAEARTAMFLDRAADVLEHGRMRLCAECGRIFVPRRRQLRHGHCAQKTWNRARKAKLKVAEANIKNERARRLAPSLPMTPAARRPKKGA